MQNVRVSSDYHQRNLKFILTLTLLCYLYIDGYVTTGKCWHIPEKYQRICLHYRCYLCSTESLLSKRGYSFSLVRSAYVTAHTQRVDSCTHLIVHIGFLYPYLCIRVMCCVQDAGFIIQILDLLLYHLNVNCFLPFNGLLDLVYFSPFFYGFLFIFIEKCLRVCW